MAGAGAAYKIGELKNAGMRAYLKKWGKNLTYARSRRVCSERRVADEYSRAADQGVGARRKVDRRVDVDGLPGAFTGLAGKMPIIHSWFARRPPLTWRRTTKRMSNEYRSIQGRLKQL